KTVWPVNLAVFYPFPKSIPAWAAIASFLAIAALSWLTLAYRKQHPWLAAGWYWYLLTLLPVIGIVQVGMQAMADRYMYVPMIGLLIAGAWAIPKNPSAPFFLFILACAVLSWRQIGVWKDGVTLFTHAIEVTAD